MKRAIAIASAAALLVVGTAFVVHAQTSGGIPQCADIKNGTGSYTPPTAATLTSPATPGRLTWDIILTDDANPNVVSCPDVLYMLTVYSDNRLPDDVITPSLVTSASMPGDGVSKILRFDLEINQNTDGSVCVTASTIGGSGTAPANSKNGAAFDADGSGSELLDRAPDGPLGGDVDTAGSDYCFLVPNPNPGSRTFG